MAGLVGSFVGGLLISLLAGDGLDLRPSGIIGSLAGAIVVTAIWRWWEDPQQAGAGGPRRSDGQATPARRTRADLTPGVIRHG